MADRIIAVGDPHGCSKALEAVLRAIRPQPRDTLVVLGDCVDRGPDSCGVVAQLLELREQCRLITLLGNHEEMMLNHFDGRVQFDDWLICGGAATLSSYGDQVDEKAVLLSHLDYIRTWTDYWETETHFFAHGSYLPDQDLSEQNWEVYRWQNIRDRPPGPHRSGKQAVLGHTSQKTGEILDLGHLLCIDTYCWGGGWLTAMDVNSERIWQANRDGRLRT